MATHTLNVAAVDLDIVRGDRKENLDAMRRVAQGLRHEADIIVFPELFSTGFVSDPGQLAALADSDASHPSLDAMKEVAANVNAGVCGSVLYAVKSISGPVQYRNRCYFVEPSGDVTYYDKRHLFCLSSEKKVFAPGASRPPVIRFRGCEVAMAVCYDLRFQCWLRNSPDKPYDLLLIPSNWPEVRQYAWNTLLAARAIENQAYVVGANRSGTDEGGTYDAMTRIYGPDGRSVGQHNPHLGAVLAVVDLDGLADMRRKFPVLQDMER